jgi:glycosyltransferase involved in cell wall biosynthesis
MNDFSLTIVVPVYNEEDCVQVFVDELKAALASVGRWEVLFVDDGSTDRTPQIIRSLHEADPRVSAIFLSRRFGNQAALIAGLDHAQGDAVVTMDVDLEHPPRVVLDLLQKWKEGSEVVIAVRRSEPRAAWWKRMGTRVLYWMLARLSSTPPIAYSADFRLRDGRVVRSLRQFEERNRFLRGLVAWVGYRQATVPYDPGQRSAGRSKYSIRQLWKMALDGMLSFSFLPLRWVTLLGLLTSMGALLAGLFYLVDTLIRGVDSPGWPSLFVSISFFSGIQLLTLGILGEYVARVYDEVKRRPMYLVRDSVGISGEPRPR